jgi:hypothetical protein
VSHCPALVAIAAILAGCTSKSAPKRPAAPDHPCPTPPGPARESWRHGAPAGVPGHAANDVVVATGSATTIEGKFAYGNFSKDLEGETVALWVSDWMTCTPREVARGTTDDDGRVRFDLPAATEPGRRDFWLYAVGDGTFAAGSVWTIPARRSTVLFDIDGTLTTDDGELFDDLIGRGAEIAPDSNAVAKHWAGRDELIIYVTGRPYLLRASTRRWLDGHRFPFGPLVTTDRMRDVIPTMGGVGEYKTAVLRSLIDAGVVFATAYGNARTDVCAYAAAGIDPARTFIYGATPDDPGCGDHPKPKPLASYTDHLRELISTR